MKKGGIMKRYLLNLLIIVGIFIIACGNEPYPDYYEGTPEDIEAIESLLDANPILLVTDDMFDPTYIPLAMGEVLFIEADLYMRDDTFMIKQHVDSCATELPQRDSTLDFWFAKDTTCTVYIYDTFAVRSLIHADLKYTAYYDSAEVDPITGDTIWCIGTVDTNSTPYYDTVDVIGNGRRLIFFEPRRDTTPTVDQETGDTTYALIEPLDWELKRLAYGTYSFPAPGTEIPDIDEIVLIHSNGAEDTIITASYDTLDTGHCMNRFRGLDSLLEFEDGETLSVIITLDPLSNVDASDCEFFASCGGERVNLGVTINEFVISGQGITNLYFEVVANDVYYYGFPEKDYKALVWLIPVRIGGVQ